MNIFTDVSNICNLDIYTTYNTNVGLPEKKYPTYKENYNESYQQLFWDSQYINFIYIAVPLFACATVIINQYGFLSTHV
jgi:hypothetical protein